jgi:hypothetical protein
MHRHLQRARIPSNGFTLRDIFLRRVGVAEFRPGSAHQPPPPGAARLGHRFEPPGEALQGGARLGGFGAVMVEERLSPEAKDLRTPALQRP